jgi:hypothetical protein
MIAKYSDALRDPNEGPPATELKGYRAIGIMSIVFHSKLRGIRL